MCCGMSKPRAARHRPRKPLTQTSRRLDVTNRWIVTLGPASKKKLEQTSEKNVKSMLTSNAAHVITHLAATACT
jgi:hypothetical protein